MLDMYKGSIWELIDAFERQFDNASNQIAKTGLKGIIPRPHNLVNVKNADGKLVAQRIEIVTTPFAKADVKVKVCDNTLKVECGSDNVKDAENENVVYRAISGQSFKFELKLAPTIDQKNITAKNEDGILKVTLPLVEEAVPEEVEITVE